MFLNVRGICSVSAQHGKVMGSMLGLDSQMAKTGATHYHTQLGLSNKGRAIKGFVVCNGWDLEPLDVLNGFSLGCYQPSPVV